jgi:hypothetical protein
MTDEEWKELLRAEYSELRISPARINELTAKEVAARMQRIEELLEFIRRVHTK